jgi:hypothetical protein
LRLSPRSDRRRRKVGARRRGRNTEETGLGGRLPIDSRKRH